MAKEGGRCQQAERAQAAGVSGRRVWRRKVAGRAERQAGGSGAGGRCGRRNAPEVPRRQEVKSARGESVRWCVSR